MARKRDYAAEYAARKARGLARGLTLNEAVGKADRNYGREYEQRVEREVRAGKRKAPNRSAPRNRKAPTGQRLTGSAHYTWPDPAGQAEQRTIGKLRSDRRVFLYCRAFDVDLAVVEEGEGESIDLAELASLDPDEALRLLRKYGVGQDFALFPNGGIRADALRADARSTGGLLAVIEREIAGTRVRTGGSPTVNPENRRERSPRGPDKQRTTDQELETFVVSVTVQWT